MQGGDPCGQEFGLYPDGTGDPLEVFEKQCSRFVP